MAIVHDRAVDVIRRRKPAGHLADADLLVAPAFQSPDVWATVSAGLDAEAVQRAIEALSAVQRQAIELAYFGGLTQQQVSDRTGVPLGTIKSRMRLGLTTMRRTMTTDGAVS